MCVCVCVCLIVYLCLGVCLPQLQHLFADLDVTPASPAELFAISLDTSSSDSSDTADALSDPVLNLTANPNAATTPTPTPTELTPIPACSIGSLPLSPTGPVCDPAYPGECKAGLDHNDAGSMGASDFSGAQQQPAGGFALTLVDLAACSDTAAHLPGSSRNTVARQLSSLAGGSGSHLGLAGSDELECGLALPGGPEAWEITMLRDAAAGEVRRASARVAGLLAFIAAEGWDGSSCVPFQSFIDSSMTSISPVPKNELKAFSASCVNVCRAFRLVAAR